MRTVTYKSVIDRIAGYMQEADGITAEDAALANVKINFFVRLAWEAFWWPELMRIEPRELDDSVVRTLAYDPPVERRKGLLKLANGVQSGALTGLKLGFQPDGFRLQVLRPYGGLNLRAYPDQTTVSPDGCTFELNAATDSLNYTVAWEAWGTEGVVPATDSDSSRKVGTVALANGVQSGTVTGLKFGFTPAVVRLQVMRPAGGLNIDAFPTTWTSDGFNFELSGLPDSGDYVLLYEVGAVGLALGPIRQRGAVTLASGVRGGRLRHLNFGWQPSWVSVQVARAGGLNINAYPLPESSTADGFEFELDGITDSTGYVLHYEVALPQASSLGVVRAIWDRDPRANRYACRVGGGRTSDFRMENGQMRVLGCANPVWVEFRARPNVYTGAFRSETATYAAGTEVYDVATGDYWTANQAVAAGESPTSHSYKWDKVEFPYIFAEYVAQSVYAMMTDREQEQPENFGVQMAAGYPLLLTELDVLERQQGQTRQLRMATGR